MVDVDNLMVEALAEMDLAELSRAVLSEARGRGVAFGSTSGPAFHIDPIPRVIDRDRWAILSAGITQRVRALECFVADVYGNRQIVEAGVIPDELIATARHYEPELAGMGERVSTWITIAGLDLVCDDDGLFQVLEDNLRTPSGIAYAVATREIIDVHVPRPSELSVRALDQAFQTLGRALRKSAPFRPDAEPTIVLLSDGAPNSAFYEHATIAAHLEIPLVGIGDLMVRNDRLFARLSDDGRPSVVDVVYRRTDEDRLTDERGRPTPLGRLMRGPLLAGTVTCVNAFGTGVADDKLTHAHVEDMIDFYLDEPPIIHSVKTYDPSKPEVLEMVLDRLDELVVKPRSGCGGHGVVIGPQADRETLRRLSRELTASPWEFIAQETISLSTHPTVTGGRLEARHIDLRPFTIVIGDEIHVLPGGLTRVAMQPGALVVNSSQDGGSKDTWVLA